MNTDDYRLADCTLFRQPPVDVSKISEALEIILVQEWQRGNSVHGAVERALEDDKIVDALTEQIAPNLDFQRETALQEVDENYEASAAE